MTKFLASVSSPQEAATILAAGADIIDIKDPLKGALGAVEPVIAKELVQRVSGRVMTSATIGDLPMKAAHISSAIEEMQATGVDIIKVGVFADSVPADILQAIKNFTDRNLRIVLVFFADRNPRMEDFSALVEVGVYGIMLDTADKAKGSLRTKMDDRDLKYFIKQARLCGLLTGLAGSLKLADIQPLLKLKPDYLGFRSALCVQHQRNNIIDMQAAHNVRAMIPAHEIADSGKQNLMLSVN
jgi:dihydroneopterin aldolase